MIIQDAETAMCADIGGRDDQQDRVAVFNSDGGDLLVVADGLGGHEGGALAAQAVVDAAQDCLAEGARDAHQSPEERLAAVVEEAHRRIKAIGAGPGAASGGRSPHSTCVLLYVVEGVATWAHVGDSRLYRFEDGRLADRTFDHSVVEMMRLQGRITEEEMKTHPDQNRLYDALGGEQGPKPDFASKPVEVGDAYLLASDGVWEHVSNAQLEAVVRAEDFATALQELVVQAKSAGGPTCDNLALAGWRFGHACSGKTGFGQKLDSLWKRASGRRHLLGRRNILATTAIARQVRAT